MKLNLHSTLLGLLIPNDLTITFIISPHLVTHLVLVSILSIGQEISRMLFIYLKLRKSTKG
jgi:hypothetical protein